jgi:hypothetical protein
MVKTIEMDELVSFYKQIEEDTGPIVFMNKFSANPDDVDEFLKRWAADAAVFKKQPGFISAQLHRGLLVAVLLLTMRFGSQLHISGMQSRLLTYKPEYQSILLTS